MSACKTSWHVSGTPDTPDRDQWIGWEGPIDLEREVRRVAREFLTTLAVPGEASQGDVEPGASRRG